MARASRLKPFRPSFLSLPGSSTLDAAIWWRLSSIKLLVTLFYKRLICKKKGIVQFPVGGPCQKQLHLPGKRQFWWWDDNS